ncbi:hypothetical protein QRD43_07260 [Pelomonas sp. APW6]|uniref:DUF3817 domain-containing protein n=1 Tax=Roseateles subflavus TaxID=3053353 RepID=A0ABT7LFS4_9BURK|nr:hypothetical protein [Pelomonas sp. APW6]MDL5031703.1 hypothetical protein [Pelomonas sp. APW6]
MNATTPSATTPSTVAQNAQIRNALESALLAALVVAVSLWLVLTGDESGGVLRATFGGLGMGVGTIAHLAYVGVALQRAGRAVWPWVIAMVLVPGVSIVAMVLMSSALADAPAAAGEQAPRAE